MPYALVHKPSPRLTDCQLTFIGRDSIDFNKALAQHDAYTRALRHLGLEVKVLDIKKDCPDSVFIEDVAVILDEVAVMASMGSPARRSEVPAMAEAIAQYRNLVTMALPAIIEGGDVLRVGRVLYVGETRRTNRQGIEALRASVMPLGYRVVSVPVHGALHLKTCITALDAETFVVNRDWFDVTAFDNFRLIGVDSSEPWAGNTMTVSGTTLVNAAYPRTADKIEARGYPCVRLDISEFAKAEAGLTCMSLIFSVKG